jgi:hypothetical protein
MEGSSHHTKYLNWCEEREREIYFMFVNSYKHSTNK